MPTAPLALLLLRASRWFDQQLLRELHREGWPALSPAQSLVFAYLEPDGTTPAELARRLGNSRQATSQLLAGLVALDLLAFRPNPARRGGLLVGLTDRGRALGRNADRILRGLEDGLGPARAEELRTLLSDFDHVDPRSTGVGTPSTPATVDGPR